MPMMLKLRSIFFLSIYRIENLIHPAEAKGEGFEPVKVLGLLLTVQRRYLCCGPSILHVAMSVCVQSLAIWSPE